MVYNRHDKLPLVKYLQFIQHQTKILTHGKKKQKNILAHNFDRFTLMARRYWVSNNSQTIQIHFNDNLPFNCLPYTFDITSWSSYNCSGNQHFAIGAFLHRSFLGKDNTLVYLTVLKFKKIQVPDLFCFFGARKSRQ